MLPNQTRYNIFPNWLKEIDMVWNTLVFTFHSKSVLLADKRRFDLELYWAFPLAFHWFLLPVQKIKCDANYDGISQYLFNQGSFTFQHEFSFFCSKENNNSLTFCHNDRKPGFLCYSIARIIQMWQQSLNCKKLLK